MKSKKGISGIITAVIMIALVIAVSTIVWTVVNNLVKTKLDEAGSCFDIFEKVKLNSKYTCYNSSSNELQFSISIEDLDISELLVSISGNGESKSFKLTPNGLTNNYLYTYPKKEQPVYLPEKNSGKTYIVDLTAADIAKPDMIQIAPIINQKQCEVADTLQQIDNCFSHS
jgi:flagellin-like protein